MPGRRNAGTPCIVGSRIANSVCKSMPSSCAHAAGGVLRIGGGGSARSLRRPCRGVIFGLRQCEARAAAVGQAFRSSRRGTAAGLSGATCEHYKVLLDDPSSCSRMLRTCLPQRKSPPTSLLHLPFPALQRCVSLPAGCGGSLLATRSAGSCRAAWHANMPTRLTTPPALTSSPFRHVLALMLCLVCCVLPSTLMPTPRSFH